LNLFILFILLFTFNLSSDPLDYVDRKYADYIKNTKKIDLSLAKTRLKKIVGPKATFPFKKPSILISKTDLTLKLYEKGKLIKTYKIGIGQEPKGHKKLKGDYKTPVGKYHLVTKNPLSNWHMFMGFNYPNSVDAKQALKDGRITKKQHDKIVKAEKIKAPPPWNTKIGGAVGIHGPYNDDYWTWGCIGMLPEDFNEIWVAIKYWTPIEIVE